MRDYQYEKEKKDEKIDARKERVKEKLNDLIDEICKEFDWDSKLFYNREDVREIIRNIYHL